MQGWEISTASARASFSQRQWSTVLPQRTFKIKDTLAYSSSDTSSVCTQCMLKTNMQWNKSVLHILTNLSTLINTSEHGLWHTVYCLSFFYYKDIHSLPTMQCFTTPVHLVSYIVAMQLLSPVRFHETYKNTKQKSWTMSCMTNLVWTGQSDIDKRWKQVKAWISETLTWVHLILRSRVLQRLRKRNWHE